MSENTAPGRERARKFKNQGRDVEDGRRKRADQSVELRKMKKDDQLMKRRNVTNVDLDEPTSPLQEKTANARSPTAVLPMDEMMRYIVGSDANQRLQAVQSARKVLSRERNPPIDDFIQIGIIPHLVKFLEDTDNAPLQFEAAWALTNIASGTCEQTQAVVKHGAIPRFVALLSAHEENVCEQAVWALGNIAGDGPQLRDLVIEAGAVAALIKHVTPDTKVGFLRNLAWTLSNLCRNKNPPPSFESCCRCLPVFSRLLQHADTEVLGDTCWALSYISDGSNEKIQAVIDCGALPKLVQLLYHAESNVITPALRAVGNIVTGSDLQTQEVVKCPGALQAFPHLLAHSKANIKKEAAWAVSNITAGNQEQIQAIIDANIIPCVIQLLDTGDFKSQKEAAWVITNLTSGGTVQQTGYVVDGGVLPPLVNLLTTKEPKTTHVVLDALSNILLAATKHGAKDALCLALEEMGCLDKLESLQEHGNDEIYLYSQKLIEMYFAEEDDEDNKLAPEAADNQFEFSQPSTSQQANFNF